MEEDLTKKREEKIKTLWQEAKEREAQRLAESYNYQYVNLKATPIETGALSLVDEEEAKKAQLAVFQKIGNLLKVAICDPASEEAIKIIEKLKQKNYKVALYVATPESIILAHKLYDSIKKRPEEFSKIIDVSSISPIDFRNLHSELLKIRADEVSLLVASIFKSAVTVDTSDVHIEPQEESTLIRFRIDGVLYDVSEIDKDKYQKIKQRLKIISGMKLNIENSPQNGRFNIQEGNLMIDVRASSLPGPNGEFLVFRLLNPKKAGYGLRDLGLSRKGEETFRRYLTSPNGMILVTGPTGSGKTTTLYTMIKEKVSPGVKIITIEDPIEYHINGVNQTQVDRNYDFATGLKSILRQDPDVIMVGEMRDKDTVTTALQAALTGHLVFSTLHTNEASGTISRLIELGAEREIIPDALKLIIAQRLVRRLCPHCKEKYPVDQEQKQKLIEAFSILSPKSGVEIPKDIPYLYRAKGCEKCHFLGYKDQIGIFEYFTMTERIIAAIQKGEDQNKIRTIAIDEGMVPLFHDGLLKVISGITSLEEVVRVAGDIDYLQEMYQDLFSQVLTRGIKVSPEEEKTVQEILNKKINLSNVIEDKNNERKLALILLTAYQSRATDVHFEPQEKNSVVRQRIDGILYPLVSFDLTDHPKIIATIKDISGLKTEETQKVQEGRTRLILPDKSIDIRVSIIPGGYGESASLRLLREELNIVDLENLGFLEEAKEKVESIVENKKTGLILSTGPTSSGKTTTLFAILKKLAKPGVKIITIEDPIEYRLPSVIQTQINEEKGYTFAVALRSLLRQNPNIFLVGEIRDKETAELVWQSSLTGHLVLSTIHANDALSVAERIRSLGIPAEEIFSAINLIIGQRLVRKLCPKCKREAKIKISSDLEKNISQALKKYPKTAQQIKKPYTFYQATGCSYCQYRGYYGLTGIFEILIPEMHNIKKIEDLQKVDFPKLIDDAIIKALLGITSLEEIERVLSFKEI